VNDLVQLRDATLDDVTFIVDANASMALETEGKMLDRALLARGTVAVFERPERGFYLVAERAGAPVACLLVTREWSDWRNGDWWWLQSVYVESSARRSGIFRRMYAEVERRSIDAGAVGLRLYVDTDNLGAQTTYGALGMARARYELFESERPATTPASVSR
jgi:GNAT superfamily N-acetyltransferase